MKPNWLISSNIVKATQTVFMSCTIILNQRSHISKVDNPGG